ncbi:hypothetical protein UFOVP1323_52 [uncultured Caudovirales phage]|uniref:Uncharacterized protein n=1 Tax=uncultured Caudovirales phage TaxID=2100421 RepID=A0A6J5RWA5_9CAUD|nr:hypothetical protein UFOVP1323_52 [uncultured Caudovirales phage]
MIPDEIIDVNALHWASEEIKKGHKITFEQFYRVSHFITVEKESMRWESLDGFWAPIGPRASFVKGGNKNK